MTQRVTEKQLQDMATDLSKATGLNITKGGAYGGTCFQIGYGSENLTGYVTKREAMDWAYAFLKGLSIGYTKHKHDMIATAKSNNVKGQFVPGTVADLTCGDCGTQITTRYESSYEIGIAPFRWLCWTCYRAYTDATCDIWIESDKGRTCRQPATHKVLDSKEQRIVYLVCETHAGMNHYGDELDEKLRVVPLASVLTTSA